MKTLLILRHAEAAAAGDDFERALTPRGRKAATRLAARMQALGLIPGMVLCSPARRAAETCALVMTGLAPDAPVTEDRNFYLASPDDLLAAIRGTPDDIATLLVVGHNPGLQMLLQALVADTPELLARPFPPGGLAAITFPVDAWSAVGPDAGRLAHYLHPRDKG